MRAAAAAAAGSATLALRASSANMADRFGTTKRRERQNSQVRLRRANFFMQGNQNRFEDKIILNRPPLLHCRLHTSGLLLLRLSAPRATGMRATRVEMRQYRAAFDDDSDDDRDSLAAAPLAGHARSTQSAGSTCASAAADNENEGDADDTPYHPVYMTAEYLRRAAKGVALARLTQLTIDATAAAGVTFSADGHLQHLQQQPPHDQQQQRSHSGGELRDDKIGTLENLELCPRLQVWNSSRFVLRMSCHVSFDPHTLVTVFSSGRHFISS